MRVVIICPASTHAALVSSPSLTILLSEYVFHVFHGIRRIPSSKNGRIPYKIFFAPRIQTVGLVIVCPASTHTALVSSPTLTVLHLPTYIHTLLSLVAWESRSLMAAVAGDADNITSRRARCVPTGQVPCERAVWVNDVKNKQEANGLLSSAPCGLRVSCCSFCCSSEFPENSLLAGRQLLAENAQQAQGGERRRSNATLDGHTI